MSGRIRLKGRFLRDQKGVAALEFALVMPILLALYLGLVASAQAMSTYRKLSDATVEAANISSQYTAMSKGDPTLILAATSQIMAPISATPLSGVLSLVQTDANNNATVTWSCAYNGGTPLNAAANIPLAAAVRQPNTSYFIVQMNCQFKPFVDQGAFPSTAMSSQAISLPRLSQSVPLTGGC